jgi:glycosyltransferase involved in cell wall biosynthesis
VVLVPCFNEERTVGQVVRGFREALPQGTVYVYDNNSTDGTAAAAAAAGAVVRAELRQGKGAVLRRMFADIEADVYVMVDGDATYDAAAASAMVDWMLREQLDMIVATRSATNTDAYRPGHAWGNRMLTVLLARMFGRTFTDVLSGYRVFSRRFVKSFPAHSWGFDTETELSIHALDLRMPVDEMATDYAPRPEGSESKLSTYKDGIRILRTMVRLYEAERPLRFFGLIAAVLALVSVVLAIPLFITYLQTGLVPRFPTAILSASLMLMAALCVVAGTILETVTLGRREQKRLAYLRYPAPGPASGVGP